MTLAQMLAAQELAGANYRAAANHLHDAYVAIASVDAALMSSNINDRHLDFKTFAHLTQNIEPFSHPIHAPVAVGDWRDEIAARRDKLIAEFDSRPARRIA